MQLYDVFKTVMIPKGIEKLSANSTNLITPAIGLAMMYQNVRYIFSQSVAIPLPNLLYPRI